MRESNTLDFHDFVQLAIELLSNSGFPEVAAHVRKKHKFVLVDEFEVTPPQKKRKKKKQMLNTPNAKTSI